MKNEIYNLKVEYYSKNEEIVCSWKYRGENIFQKAYEICVFDGEKKIFTTGKKENSDSFGISISPELEYEKEYKLTVVAILASGETLTSSSCFETEPQTLTAPFISPDEQKVPETFELIGHMDFKDVSKARMYVTALGIYALYINGERVNEGLLDPGWTTYDKMLQYQTYNLLNYAKPGENEIVIKVGRGWFSGNVGYIMKSGHYGKENAALVEIHTFDKDGNKTVIADPGFWEMRSSVITENDLFHGETHDYTIQTKTLKTKTFDYPREGLIPQCGERVLEVNTFKPISESVKDGKTIYDFGYNISGYIHLKLKNTEKGQVITLRHAEVLNPDGTLYTENLREARATDEYILPGGCVDIKPIFTFHGFRYAEISGLKPENIEKIESIEITSKLQKTGFIETNDKDINTLIDNVFRSNRGNFVDIPTDCPQRNERCGWTGDANAFACSAAYNYDIRRFFKKWLKNMKIDQHPDGRMPNIVPRLTDGSNTAALWAESVVRIPYTLYTMYGDVSFLKINYDGMKRFVDHVLDNMTGSTGLIDRGFQFGDWLSLDKDPLMRNGDRGGTDECFLANMLFSNTINLFVKTAQVLGYKEDANKYSTIYKKHKEAIQDEYVTKSGRLANETQTALVLALVFDIVKEKDRQGLADRLVKNIRLHDTHHTTGFAGTPFLMFALSDNGYHDVARELLFNRTYPSWLYEVDRGATTIWERWNGIKENGEFNDPAMNSFNHYAYGSVIEFIYKRICGFEISLSDPKYFKLSPKYTKGITNLKSSFDSVYGEIKIEYSQGEDGVITNVITIPQNCKCTIELPGMNAKEYNPGTYEFKVPYESLKI